MEEYARVTFLQTLAAWPRGRCRMPVYEYFCPHCFVELELLQPIQRASEFLECPNCSAQAWRLVSGFGCRTGSYLQPSVTPFRDEFGPRYSRSSSDVTVIEPMVEEQETPVGIEMSWLVESQPNGSNLWFIHNWGIASILRYLREDVDTKPAERLRYLEEVMQPKTAEPVPDYSQTTSQWVGIPAVRPWPDEEIEPQTTEPVRSTEYKMPAVEPAVATTGAATLTSDREATSPSRIWWPTSYFGWFLLLAVCLTAIIVPVVWLLAISV